MVTVVPFPTVERTLSLSVKLSMTVKPRPLLSLAAGAMSCGSAMPAVLNAADEVAVEAFLSEKIPFYRISEIVSEVFSRMMGAMASDVESLIACDRTARKITEKLIEGR